MKRWLSPAEAVAEGYLSSLRTAARLRAERRGPPYRKLGSANGPIRYDRKELEDWINRQRVLVEQDLMLGRPRLRVVR